MSFFSRDVCNFARGNVNLNTRMWGSNPIKKNKTTQSCGKELFYYHLLAESSQTCPGPRLWAPIAPFFPPHWIQTFFRSSMSFNLLCFVLLVFGFSGYGASDIVSVGRKSSNWAIFRWAAFVVKVDVLRPVLHTSFTLFGIRVFVKATTNSWYVAF